MAESQTFYLSFAPAMDILQHKGISCKLGRGHTNAFGVYIGHRISHQVLATSATLFVVTRRLQLCPNGPKDQKSRCPASKQVISCLMALK